MFEVIISPVPTYPTTTAAHLGLAGPIVTITNLLESLAVGTEGDGGGSTTTSSSGIVVEEEERLLLEGGGEEEQDDDVQVGMLLRSTSMQDGVMGGERCRVVLGPQISGDKWAKVLRILDDEMSLVGCDGSGGLSYSVRSGRSSLLLHGPIERVSSAKRRIMEVVDPEGGRSRSTPPLPEYKELLPPSVKVVPTVEIGEEVRASSGSISTSTSTSSSCSSGSSTISTPTTTTTNLPKPPPPKDPGVNPSTTSTTRSVRKSSIDDSTSSTTAPTTIPSLYDPPPLLPRDLPGSLRWASEEERIITEGLMADAARGDSLSKYKLVILEILKALPGKKVLVSSTLGLLMKQVGL